MTPRQYALALMGVLALWFPPVSEAQKVYRVSALVASDLFVPAFEGFKKKMAELGYVEGRNVNYDFHNAKGDQDTLHKLARKLVQDKPDLIVTSSTSVTIPVAKLTEGTNLPVIFVSASDPLRFVKSYASSGNNLTGVSNSSLDLIEKRMELLKEVVPGIKRVIVLEVPSGTNYEASHRLIWEAGKKLGVDLTGVHAAGHEEIKSKISALITRKLGEAVFLPPDILVTNAIEEIARQAIKERLPLIGTNIDTIKKGALATYTADYFELGQQGAIMANKILKGAKPADLPIEQPSRLNLVVNLKTARAIGLKVSKEILLRADEVIE
jgi:putative ABC transport system substrate-binding protein